MALNEYAGFVYPGGPNGALTSGDQTLIDLGMGSDNVSIGTCAIVLFAMVIFLMLLAFFALKRIVYIQSRPVPFRKVDSTTRDVVVKVE